MAVALERCADVSEKTAKILRRVTKHILASPKRLVMGNWVETKTTYNSWFNDEIRDGSEYASCGTAACIAGWTVLLTSVKNKKFKNFVNKREHKHTYFDWERAAGKKLGITEEQATRLFHVENWPRQFGRRFKMRGDEMELSLKQRTANAKAAAERIEYFIATGV